MVPYQDHPCDLTRRLAEDMIIRNMARSTIGAYTYHRPVQKVGSTKITVLQLVGWTHRMATAEI